MVTSLNEWNVREGMQNNIHTINHLFFMLPKFTSYMKYSLGDIKQHSINQSINQSPLFGVTSGLTTSWRFFRIVSLMISSIRGLGSSTGTRRVLPRCWLNCRAHPSTCPSLHHSLMDAWLRRSHTPSSLWIYRNPIVSNCEWTRIKLNYI